MTKSEIVFLFFEMDLFLLYFWSFQADKQNHFYNKSMWKSVHPVSGNGFDPANSWTRVISHNH